MANYFCKEQLASRLLYMLDQSAQLKLQTVGFIELDLPGPGDWLGKSVAGLSLQAMAMSSVLAFQRWLNVQAGVADDIGRIWLAA
jgi:hypothetical protein